MSFIPYDVQTEAIISAGMKLLREHLGSVETEIFISKVGKKGFDYTKWRENLWEEMSLDEVIELSRKSQAKYRPPDGVDVV